MKERKRKEIKPKKGKRGVKRFFKGGTKRIEKDGRFKLKYISNCIKYK